LLSRLVITLFMIVIESLAGESSLPSQKGCSSGCAQTLTPPVPQGVSTQKGEKILVFVSLLMPEAAFKVLAHEAPLYNAVLVMRGLYQDSFAKTAQKLQELGISVDINPELFETHHVTSVPTFLLMRDNQPTHRLKGNVTLKFAANKLKEAA
jgi:type-F conjugative transfer system pilin assembly protein TrbC